MGWDVGYLLHAVSRRINQCANFEGHSLVFYKLKVHTPFNPDIPSLGTLLNDSSRCCICKEFGKQEWV